MRISDWSSDVCSSDLEVTAAYLKSLHHAPRLAGDTRLKPVLGADIGAARPDRAEAWRSGRSLRNIVLGLEAAQALYLGEGGSGIGLEHLATASQTDAKIGPLLTKAFAMTLETARGIGKPLPEAVVDPATRPPVEKLEIGSESCRERVGQYV